MRVLKYASVRFPAAYAASMATESKSFNEGSDMAFPVARVFNPCIVRMKHGLKTRATTRRSSDLCKLQRRPELLVQRGAEMLVLRMHELRVALQHLQGIRSRDLQKLDFAGDVGHLEFGQAVLLGAEEMAGAAKLQVHF